jgi:NitT/TauT family transport system permease protein
MATSKTSRIAWAGILLIVPLWEGARTLFSVSPLLMPPILDIGLTLIEGIGSGVLLRHAAVSILVIVGGMATAWVLVAVSVVLAERARVVEAILVRLNGLFHPLPGIAILPIVVLWFGIGPVAVIVVIVHSVYWPVLTNALAGYRSIPETWRLLARNMEITGISYLARIALPAVSPYLIAALRIAWSRSWRALISAEMVFGAVAAYGGMGWYLFSMRVFMDATGLFAGLLFIMAIGSSVEHGLLRVVERRTVERWGMST